MIPQIHTSGAADTIVTQTLSPLGTFGRMLSETVRKRQKPSDLIIGGTLFNARSCEAPDEIFDFLEYSSENVFFHTSRMTYASPAMVRLFRRLLLIHPQYTSWLEKGHSSYTSAVLGGNGDLTSPVVLPTRSPRHNAHIAPNVSLQLQWAISHSHSLALSMSLHGKSGLKALLSVARYLIYLMNTGRQLRLASHMCEKLLKITTLFRCKQPTDWLIETNRYSLSAYLAILRDSDWYGYPTFRWAVVRDCSHDLYNVVDPLLEEALANKDIQTARSLIRRGVSLDAYSYEPPLRTAMRLSSSDPEYLLLVLRMLLAVEDLDVFRCYGSDLDGFLDGLFRFANPRTILSHACNRGGQPLIERILAGQVELCAHNCNELLCKPFYGHAYEPIDIVSLLTINWSFYTQSYEPAVRHAVQLRDWHLASEISRFLGRLVPVNRGLLASCVAARDGYGVNFVLKYAVPSQKISFKAPWVGPVFFGGTASTVNPPEPQSPDDGSNSNRLFSQLASYWEGLEDCYELTKFAASIQNTFSHLTDTAKENWLVKGDDELVLKFSQLVLIYLVDEDPCSEACLLTESSDLRASVLFHLDNLLEDFSHCSSTSKPAWIGLAKMVLQRYRELTSYLATFHTYPLSLKEVAMVDQIHILRTSFIRIEETLLRKRHAALGWSRAGDDWSAMIEYYFAGWYPDASMETLLRLHGFQKPLLNLKGRPGSIFAGHTMPLGWEAYAAGPKVVRLFKDDGIALDEMRAVESCLSSPALDSSEETASVRTVAAWRAKSLERFSVCNPVELPVEEHTPGVQVPTQSLHETTMEDFLCLTFSSWAEASEEPSEWFAANQSEAAV